MRIRKVVSEKEWKIVEPVYWLPREVIVMGELCDYLVSYCQIFVALIDRNTENTLYGFG